MAKHILITGVVHRVGFRPFVYALATQLDLHGWVCNTSTGLEIFIEGKPWNVERFIEQLSVEKPTQARIDSIKVCTEEAGHQFQSFDIISSIEPNDLVQPLPVDLAICPTCERELFDPRSRRYLYPFISCVECGPRFSILKNLPYERSNTTMAEFGMCESCSAEYEDLSGRRFHLHSIACPECGPFVALREIHSKFPYTGLKISSIECRTSAILKARRLLREGYILAIKGLGGFHLACDASNSLSVEELRDRKGRVGKPFALMASDIEMVRTICRLGPAEEKLLTSREKPIVLLEKKVEGRQGYNVSKWVAPNLDTLGVMLPYTPLHHLLLNQTDPLLRTEPAPPLLVMTSGSLAEEPIATDDEDALLRLSSLADAFILHNRQIHMRCDDSVVRVDSEPRTVDNQADHSESTIYVRRARGYAPYSLKLPFEVMPTLAVGSEFTNTLCLARDGMAFLSQHIGNMENVQTYEAFEKSVAHLSHAYQVLPEIIAYDLHPGYFSTQYVRRSTLVARQIKVQHHHAHVAACMADNGLDDRKLIGLCFDGTGYGTDGAFWGGEILLASYSDFDRFAHLEYLPLPGGESASRTPWRIAVAYADALGLKIGNLPFLQQIEKQTLEHLRQQTEAGISSPHNSCMESLFNTAACLIGIRNENTYESQAILEMEALARPFVPSATCYPFMIETTQTGTVIRLKDLLAAIVQDVCLGRPIEMTAARFQKTIAEIAVEVCRQARRATDVNEAVLSGSIWQNQTLMNLVRQGLTHDGFTVYYHCSVPTNDGGLAVGQTAVANHSLVVQEIEYPTGYTPTSRDHRLPD